MGVRSRNYRKGLRGGHLDLDEQTPSVPWSWYDYREELHWPSPSRSLAWWPETCYGSIDR